MPAVYFRTFGPFQENTVVVDAGEGRAIVVDPGMSQATERAAFQAWLAELGLAPAAVVLTHAHLDHVAGCGWMEATYGLRPLVHPLDAPTYQQAPLAGQLYGFPLDPLPEPEWGLEHGTQLDWGAPVEVRWVPGHAPGHVVFVCAEGRWVVGGDVLFRESVGRTDLPGGDARGLALSIAREFYTLPDDYQVFPGHGEPTTIGHERRFNPFVNAAGSGLLQDK
jgi:glyoxylase-like metal-dependent hydrolase (beta-lactamase superfamily II)